MTADAKGVTRQLAGSRAKRVVGTGTGTLIGVVVCWGWHEVTGRPMPGEVGAAIGGLCAGFLLCFDDLRALMWLIADRRFTPKK